MTDSNIDDSMDTFEETEGENIKDKSSLDFKDHTESEQKTYEEAPVLDHPVSEETFYIESDSVIYTSQDPAPTTEVSNTLERANQTDEHKLNLKSLIRAVQTKKKQQQHLVILGNLEILCRTCPREVPCLVTLKLHKNKNKKYIYIINIYI